MDDSHVVVVLVDSHVVLVLVDSHVVLLLLSWLLGAVDAFLDHLGDGRKWQLMQFLGERPTSPRLFSYWVLSMFGLPGDVKYMMLQCTSIVKRMEIGLAGLVQLQASAAGNAVAAAAAMADAAAPDGGDDDDDDDSDNHGGSDDSDSSGDGDGDGAGDAGEDGGDGSASGGGAGAGQGSSGGDGGGTSYQRSSQNGHNDDDNGAGDDGGGAGDGGGEAGSSGDGPVSAADRNDGSQHSMESPSVGVMDDMPSRRRGCDENDYGSEYARPTRVSSPPPRDVNEDEHHYSRTFASARSRCRSGSPAGRAKTRRSTEVDGNGSDPGRTSPNFSIRPSATP